GTYIVSGYLGYGMIEVSTTEKVKLKLNGVDITNSTGPAVLVSDAKRLTMTLIEGTVNSLTGGSAAHDGAIFSNDTLEIKGAGTLYVNGTVEHGISSDDDIVVKNGDIYVNAVKTGMMANDDITVSGGTLHVTGGTNGMKSKGTMHIAGGSLWVTGGPKETKSGLYSATTFTVTGGYIYVIGCDASAPDAATSTQCALAVKFVPSLAGGSSACISSGGVALFDAYSDMAYNTVFICSPDIWDGMEFNVSANGVDYGVFNTAGMMTNVTAGS
ncbi:MAG: carbohydrate-binding domain-containing protein, partial [Oscillospiraceae bacterium]|nr:carbohydrate-binding domain-containing protein [Oscillospiraceae bacterium]